MSGLRRTIHPAATIRYGPAPQIIPGDACIDLMHDYARDGLKADDDWREP